MVSPVAVATLAENPTPAPDRRGESACAKPSTGVSFVNNSLFRTATISERPATMAAGDKGAFARLQSAVRALEEAAGTITPEDGREAYFRRIARALPGDASAPDPAATVALSGYLRRTIEESQDARRRAWAKEASAYLASPSAPDSPYRALAILAEKAEKRPDGKRWRRAAVIGAVALSSLLLLGRVYTLKITRIDDTYYIHDVLSSETLVCARQGCARATG